MLKGIMMFEYIEIAMAFFVLAIASYTDIKKGTISDRLTYPAIGVGILLNALSGIYNNNPIAAMSGVAGAMAFFTFGYVLWRLGQLGGGDVGLFAALGALLPNVGSASLPLFGFPILAICIGGALMFLYSAVCRKRSITAKSVMAPFILAGLFLTLFLT